MANSGVAANEAVGGAASYAQTAIRQTTIRDYIALLKPRVMSLVVFSGFAGLFLAPERPHPLISAIAVFCIALASGASGAINMWYERDSDALMRRTKHRPIPAGRIPADYALDFAVMCAIGSVVLMAALVNVLAAFLLLSAICFYVFIYTIWLKRRTPQNIVIGGAAGAFPPVIGWAAATGQISPESLLLFAIVFFWTPPHFWALSLYRCGDYARAGIPMMPVVAGIPATARLMLAYTLLLIPITLLPQPMGISGAFYSAGASLLGIMFISHAVRVWRDPSEKNARAMFGFSILYLFGIFSLMMLDKILQAA